MQARDSPLVGRRSRGEEIPEGGVEITADEAVMQQHKLLLAWKPDSDVRAVFLGPALLIGFTGFSGCYINYLYRRSYRVARTGAGRILSYSIVLTVPTLVNYMIYDMTNYRDLMLGKVRERPRQHGVSLGIRQLALGSAYPVVMSSAANIYYAIVAGTMALPQMIWPATAQGLYEHGRSMFAIWLRQSRCLILPVTGLAAVQFFGSIILVHLQLRDMSTVERKLKQRIALAQSFQS